MKSKFILMKGVVIKSTGNLCQVLSENNKTYSCKIKGKTRLMNIEFTNPISVGDIRQLVTNLKTRGIGVLITDHNVRETLELVDRAYILHDGKVLMSGKPDDVIENENVRRVYLGDSFRIS